MSRKAHEPNETTIAEVNALVGFGVQQDQIAKYLGIDAKTLRKHYRKQIDTGTTRANMKVAASLYKKATSDDFRGIVAAIFWLKTRGGWRETGLPEAGEAPKLDITFEVKKAVGKIKVTNAKS